MPTVKTRKNQNPDLPTTNVFEGRSLFFEDSNGPYPVVAFWTIEYQPSNVIIREEAVEELLPQFTDIQPTEAAQMVYSELREILFPDQDEPPMLVQMDYTTGEDVYKTTNNYPYSVTVGRFK